MSEQQTQTTLEIAPEASQLDWFIGTWTAKSRMKGPDGWAEDTCESTIEKILGGHALMESFWGVLGGDAIDAKSIRVYNPRQNRWEQAWIDNNSRSVVNYVGHFKDGQFVGQNKESVDKPDAERKFRETFYDITQDHFLWKLDISKEGGEWETIWELDYTRQK